MARNDKNHYGIIKEAVWRGGYAEVCKTSNTSSILVAASIFLYPLKLLYNKIMANILPENETVTFEDQTYVNPETSLNEQNTFIDNLRASQARQNAEIQQQTQDLGTEVPSNLGGLTGGEGYFTSRYQTPQTNALVEQLRSTAQAQALTDVLSNQQAMWKQRYNEAYKSAQKRAAARASSGGTATTTSDTTTTGGTNEQPFQSNTGVVGGSFSGEDLAKGGYYVYDQARKEWVWSETADNTGAQQRFDDNNNPVPLPSAQTDRGYPTAWDWFVGQIHGVNEARRQAFGG